MQKQGGMKMIKAAVFTEEDGQSCKVLGRTLDDVMRSIFNYLGRKAYDPFNLITVTLSTGERFNWSPMTAYYCFSKRQISEKEALIRMIKKAS